MVFRLRPPLKIGWNSALRGTSLTLEKCPWPGDTRGAKEKEISMGHSKKKKLELFSTDFGYTYTLNGLIS